MNLDTKDQNLDIILIDKNNYFEFICSTAQSLTDPEHLNRTTITYTKLRESFRTPHVTFKRGKLVKVHDRCQAIEIELDKNSKSTQKEKTEVNSKLLEMPC